MWGWVAVIMIMTSCYGVYLHVSKVLTCRRKKLQQKRNAKNLSYMEIFYRRRLIQKYNRIKREHGSRTCSSDEAGE